MCVAGKIGNEGLQLAEGKIYLIVICPQQAFVLLFVLSALYVIRWNYRCKCVCLCGMDGKSDCSL